MDEILTSGRIEIRRSDRPGMGLMFEVIDGQSRRSAHGHMPAEAANASVVDCAMRQLRDSLIVELRSALPIGTTLQSTDESDHE